MINNAQVTPRDRVSARIDAQLAKLRHGERLPPERRIPAHREIDRDRLGLVIRGALDRGKAEVLTWRKAGAIRTPHTWLLRYSGNCSNPKTLERIGYPLQKGAKSVQTGAMTPLSAQLEVACRKCDNCLRRRASHWRQRALSETKSAGRTWFGTLTLSAEQHALVAAACRHVSSRNGDDWDTFSPERQFRDRHRCISRELTLYLKRLRKMSAAQIRFCVVVEAHKTGLPHYHILVHETGATHVTYRQLSDCWRVGFTNFKLVRDARAASYVTKYLAKSSKARVRASLDYGQTPSGIVGSVRAERETSDLPEGNARGVRGVSTRASEASASFVPVMVTDLKKDSTDVQSLPSDCDQTIGGARGVEELRPQYWRTWRLLANRRREGLVSRQVPTAEEAKETRVETRRSEAALASS